MGAVVQRYFVPAVVGFAPLILFLLNWDAEQMSRSARILREYTVPVFIAEIFTIVIAIREGMIGSWKELRPRRTAMFALATLLAIAVGTAAFVAPAPIAATVRTGFWIAHLLFGFSIAFLCARSFSAADLIAAYLAGFAVLAMAFIIFSVGALGRPIDWVFGLPSFAHIRHLGIYATPMISLCIGIMATMARRDVWAIAFVIAAAGFALVLWTGSRGPVVAVGSALFAGAIASPEMRRPAVWLGAIASVAIAFCIVAFLPVPDPDMMGVFRTVVATTKSADVTTGRMQLWALVIQAIEHRPLLGYGEGQMQEVAHFGRMGQPHNLFLQILLAWGIAGLLCVLVLAIFLIRMTVSAVRKDAARNLPPVLAMIALLTLSMLDAALYHVLPVSIFAACVGMIAAGQRARANPPAKS